MLSQIWGALLDYLKRTPYWSRIEPFVLAAFMYVGVVVCTFQYVQWRYGVTLELPLFLHSYLFAQTTVGFVALLASLVVLTRGLSRGKAAETNTPVVQRPPRWVARLAVVLLIAAGALFALSKLAPTTQVSSVRVLFAPRGVLSADDLAAATGSSDAEKLNTDALVYLVFTLNRLQRAWHFELDLRPLAWNRIRGPAEEQCRRDPMPSLCFAKAYYQQERARDRNFPPVVIVSGDPLGTNDGQYYFWLHEDRASVITTRDWQGIGAPSLYEYLAYTLLLQGVLVHLDAHCGGVPPRKPEREGIIYGNVFEYYPERDAFKAAILAGHLGPDDERLLLNCFGASYLDTTATLLKLDWLRTDPVKSNLRTVYGVEIGGDVRSKP